MTCCRNASLPVVFIIAMAVAVPAGHAQWVLIDSFDGYEVGSDLNELSNGHGTWTSTLDFYAIDVDPTDDTNQVMSALEVVTGTNQAYLDDPRINVPDGTTATLFARFYRGDIDSHVNFGLSDVADPADWGDFEAQVRDRTGELFARNGADFTLFDNIDLLPEEEWINYWIVMDNATDANEYYLQSDSISDTPLKLSAGGDDVFDFRNGTTDPLIRFFFRTNNQDPWYHYGPWFLDDVYLDTSGENLTVPEGQVPFPGDYNSNQMLDAGDLDLQAEAITGGLHPKEYDLNNDDLVNYADRLVWVNDLKNTWIGDANLDGLFNSGDMVQVFVKGKYETGETAGWEEGDWNGDTFFGSSDMVAAFVAGGYEKGEKPIPAVGVVPEPSSLVLALPLLFILGERRRRRA